MTVEQTPPLRRAVGWVTGALGALVIILSATPRDLFAIVPKSVAVWGLFGVVAVLLVWGQAIGR